MVNRVDFESRVQNVRHVYRFQLIKSKGNQIKKEKIKIFTSQSLLHSKICHKIFNISIRNFLLPLSS